MLNVNNKKKKNFFGWLTGFANPDTDTSDFTLNDPEFPESALEMEEQNNNERELSVDVHHTPTEIIIQTMPAGVRPEDLTISITPEIVIISGKRDAPNGILPENYVLQELYWGPFSRTITLPHEILPDEAEAISKHGLLVIRLPKIDKTKQHQLKVKML
jgi:HSP20 family protein